MNVNTLLEEYYQKFDDSEIKEMVEKLGDMMHERREFFTIDGDIQDKELDEAYDNYYYKFDDACCNIETYFEVIDELQSNVKGISPCGACGKMGVIKHKLLTSVIIKNMYIADLCEHCYPKKHLIMKSKKEVTVDTEISSDLTDQEKEIMVQYQKKISLEKN